MRLESDWELKGRQRERELRNIVHFNHGKGRKIFSEWRPKNLNKQTKRVNIFVNQMWASNAKDELNTNMFTGGSANAFTERRPEKSR